MKYFNNCKDLADLKKEYKELAFRNHPDMGGKIEVMQLINAEFDMLFKSMPKSENTTSKEFRNSFYTANGWVGSRYKTEYTLKDIAGFIRAYIKDVYPTWKFSVKIEHYMSIVVSITEVPYQILDYDKLEKFSKKSSIWSNKKPEEVVSSFKRRFENKEDFQNIGAHCDILKDSAAKVVEDVKNLIASYNYDDSDSMVDYFDTNFYTSFNLGSYTRKNGYWDIVPRTERITSNKSIKSKRITA